MDFARLDEHLRVTAHATPDASAYTYLEKTVSYGQLYDEVLRVAGGLLELGFKSGDGLAILLPNCAEFVTVFHGALRAGMFCVPMNPLYAPSELLYMIKDSGVKVIVAPEQMASMAPLVRAAVPGITLVVVGRDGTAPDGVVPYESLLTHEPGADTLQSGSVEDLAVVLYTSGTTGKPKGAMLTHRNLSSVAVILGNYMGYAASDRIIAVLPLFHAFGLTVCLNTAIYTGAEIIILPRFRPSEVLAVIQATRATIFVGVPTMYSFILQAAGDAPVDVSSVHHWVSGGAAMPVAVMEAFERRFGAAVLEGYGLSEASPVTAFAPVDGRPRKVGSIGVTLPMMDQRVVDAEDREVTVGEFGELVVRGPNVMKGYLGRPDDTAAVLRDGWLHTGDIARMDEDGYFYIVDRKKDMIIVGGFNVYPREVEEVLFGHEGISESAVIGVPDDQYGETVLAFVVRRNDSLTAEDIQAFCADRLAKYKRPTRIVFVDELPKNTMGKVLRRELKERFAGKPV